MENTLSLIEYLESLSAKIDKVQYLNIRIVIEQIILSWLHYIFLSRMSNNEEGDFYEIEAVENSWALRAI